MKKIFVKRESTGIRIDKFLAKEFFSLGMTRGEIIRNIKSGDILVNDKKVKPSYKLCSKDIIISNFQFPISKIFPNPNIKIKIIHQDENIIVIDKPAGIQAHPDNKEKNNTIVNWLVYKFPEIKNVHDDSKGAELRPGIVHRLDKDTSGVMVIARNVQAFQELKKIFKEHKVEKKYLAIVYGKLKNKVGVIEKPIARAGNYRKQTVASQKTKTKIREAVTHYKVLKEFKNHSLLEVMPKTGRMHQIRVHLFSIEHPIVGDKLYKFKQKEKNSKLSLKINRQMLHASQIEFKIFGKGYFFYSPIPEDFRKIQEFLER